MPTAAEMFGPDYPPCGEQSNTVAIVDCVEAKTKVWNERLNKAYKELPQRLDARQLGPLKDAQRLWIKYRDANCGFYGSQEGTIRQIQAAECIRSMTKDRALELESAMKFD
ncbi:MAG: lysozyme inhibitor LprI family protein [Methylocella sp.]